MGGGAGRPGRGGSPWLLVLADMTVLAFGVPVYFSSLLFSRAKAQNRGDGVKKMMLAGIGHGMAARHEERENQVSPKRRISFQCVKQASQ